MMDSNTMGPGMMGPGMMGPGMMGLGLVWMFVLFVGLIALVVWLVKAMFPQNGRGQNPQEQRADKGDHGEAGTLETAWQRYARGEITAEEFARLERDLT